MIIFKRVSMANFLSIGKKGVTYDLESKGVTLICGKNGMGKSAMIDAIHFGLFGRPFRKIKQNQIINSLNKKGLLVTLEFSIDGTDYKIDRGISPGVFIIYKDGNLVPAPASKNDYQNILENNILQFTPKTFQQVVVLGSSSFTPFMLLSNTDRRNIIEDLLDLRLFSQMNENVRGRITSNKTIMKTLQHSIELLEKEIDIKETNNKKISDQSDTHSKILLGKIETSTLEVDQIRLNMSDTDEKIQAVVPRSTTEVSKRMSGLDSHVFNFGNMISTIDKDVALYTDNEFCPSCLQDIDDDNRTTQLARLEKERAKYEQGISRANVKMEGLKQQLTEMEAVNDRLKAMQNNREDMVSSLLMANHSLSVLQSEYETLLRNKEKTLEDVIYIKEQLVSKQEEKSAVFDTQVLLGDISDILRDDGIKSVIISGYIPALNSLISRNLGVLDFPCRFTFDKEFNEIIKSRGRDTFSYQSFSEGERARISLALLFAFREIAAKKNTLSTNLLLLDEFTGGVLDEEGIQGAMKLIKECSSSTFIISHEDDVQTSEFVDRTIELVKTGSFTSIKG